MTDPDGGDDLSDVVATLYAGAPEDFVRDRSDLASTARSEGDRARAKRIAALRRPTVAASVVNRHVLAEPAVTERLRAVGDRLRDAQGNPDGIDRDLLRELSIERRTLVQDVARQALELFAPSAGAAVRDEVVATLDAAVADPEVAARLGRLTHAELWSGLGVVADVPCADLTVVAGGRSARSKAAAKPRKAQDGTRPARPTVRASSVLAAAEKKLSAAQDELDEADGQVSTTRARVTDLTEQLAVLQQQLARAEKDVKAAVGEQRAARSRHREAQSARNRAARRADT